jgi:DNA mismatch repair protein MutS
MRSSTNCALLGSNTEQFLLDLERRERERSGLSSLKLGFNRVQGFFIEVNRSQAERVPATTCAARP